MNEIKTDLLVTTFTNLFAHRKHFECEDGWFELIWNLSFKLEKLILKELDKIPEYEEENLCFCVDVKEKFGSLRFYMSVATDEMLEHIDKAEEDSMHICELCGKEGKLRPGGWYFTRCEECWDKLNTGKKSPSEKNEKK